jgi:tetratricopeptide (TPR) repeat protein
MDFFNPTYYTQIYRKFKAIKPSAYREVVRFYEKEENQILRLDFDEFFEMLVAYVNALFEIGAYRKHLTLVDVVIEKSINHNIHFYRNEDLFQKMLFRKAASLFNTQQYDQAEGIVRQLLRMHPKDPSIAHFYQKCRLKARPELLNYTRATAVFLFFLSALIIALEVLFVRPWYDLHLLLVMNVRSSIFGLASLSLILGFGANYYLAHRDTKKLLGDKKK